MNNPFSGPVIKIQRARKHLAELEEEAAAFNRQNPMIVSAGVSNQPPGLWFRCETPFPGAREEWGAVVGDVIHNLRTALDLTACALARVNGHDADDVYFPFCRSADDLGNMIKSRKFHLAGEGAVAFLRELKPYHGGNFALRAIHDLDVRDKHQSLISTATSIISPGMQMWDKDGRYNPAIVGESTIASDIIMTFPAGASFQGLGIIPTLHELVQLVTGIVEAFAALVGHPLTDRSENAAVVSIIQGGNLTTHTI